MTTPSYPKLGTAARADAAASVPAATVLVSPWSGTVGGWVCECGLGFEFLSLLRLHELVDGCGETT